MKKIWKFMIALLLVVSPVVAVSVSTANNNSVVSAASKTAKRHKRVVKQKKHKKRKRLSQRDWARRTYKKELTPYRTVGINLDESDPLYKDIIQGINAWNATGVYTFKVTNKEYNDIWIETDESTWDVGIAARTMSFPLAPGSVYLNKDENRILKFDPAHIFLHTRNMEDMTDRQKVTVVVHELGHAIGLKHNYQQSIMSIAEDPNTYSTVGYNFDKPTPYDIAKVKQMYREK